MRSRAITPYTATGCLSQGVTGQLSARAYAGNSTTQTNISCQVGHLTYTPQTSAVVTIDENGVATAQHPGSTVITSTLAEAASSAGLLLDLPADEYRIDLPGLDRDQHHDGRSEQHGHDYG